MLIPTKIFFQLIKCFFLSIFIEKYNIIINQLIKSKSFRIFSNKDILLLVKLYVKNSLFLFSKKNKPYQLNSKLETILYSSDSYKSETYLNEKIEYLKKIKNISNPDLVITRDMLFIKKILQKIEVILVTGFGLLIAYPIFIALKSRRENIALMFLSFNEWVSLVNCLTLTKGKNLYIYDPYESDSSFISYLSTKESYKVYMFPSANPLRTYYSYIFCNVFVTTFPYHLDELRNLNFKFMYDKILEYPHLDMIPLEKHYYFGNNSGYKYKYSYISSASWYRKESGLLYKNDFYDSEKKTYNFLKNWINEIDPQQLIILLHPRELVDIETYEEAKSFYKKIFQVENLNFSQFNNQLRSSFQYFNKIELYICSSLAMHSALLYCGYKSIYSALSFNEEYFVNSALKKTIAFDENSLIKKIKKFQNIDPEKYFEQNQIANYRFDRYRKLFDSDNNY